MTSDQAEDKVLSLIRPSNLDSKEAEGQLLLVTPGKGWGGRGLGRKAASHQRPVSSSKGPVPMVLQAGTAKPAQAARLERGRGRGQSTGWATSQGLGVGEGGRARAGWQQAAGAPDEVRVHFEARWPVCHGEPGLAPHPTRNNVERHTSHLVPASLTLCLAFPASRPAAHCSQWPGELLPSEKLAWKLHPRARMQSRCAGVGGGWVGVHLPDFLQRKGPSYIFSLEMEQCV